MSATTIRARRAAATITVLAATLAPATAGAAPTLTPDRECYAADADVMTLTGAGYSPSAPIALFFAANGKFGSFQTTADGTGAFSERINAPTLDQFAAAPPRFELNITANDQTLVNSNDPTMGVGAATVTVSAWDVNIAAWNRAAPAVRRGQKVALATTGWTTAGPTLYVHYLRGSKAVHSDKLGALTGPCGDLSKSFKAFGWKSAKPGVYKVRFSTSPTFDPKGRWMGYKAVRLKK